MDIGYCFGDWYVEGGFGYSGATWKQELGEERGTTNTEKVNWYIFNPAGLYKIVDPDPIELDVGLRFQLHSAKWDWTTEESEERSEYTDSDKVSGWSVGRVVRARWYFADGALALAPEVYPKYTSLEYKWEYTNSYEHDEEADITSWDTEYSLSLEFFFSPD